MEKQKSKQDDWIKVQSKSRPGRYYLFNRSTGETQWLSPVKGTKGGESSNTEKETKAEYPPRVLEAKALKTPAQDRLKRLQNNLKADRLKKEAPKSRRRSQTEVKSKKLYDSSREQQENVSKEQPTTSGNARNKVKLLSDSREQQENVSITQPTASRATKTKELLPILTTKSLPSPTKTTKRPHSSVNETAKDEVNKKLAKISADKEIKKTISAPHSTLTRTVDEDIEMASIDSNATLNKPQSDSAIKSDKGILGKFKDIFKLPFTSLRTLSNISEKDKQKTQSIPSSSTSSLPALEASSEQKKIENQNILNKSLEISASSSSSRSSSKLLTQKNKLKNERKDKKSLATIASSSKASTSSIAMESLNKLKNQQKQYKNQKDDKKSLVTKATSSKASISSIVLESLNELKNQQNHFESPREVKKSLPTFSTNSSPYSTPNNCTIPKYQRGSANSRLDRLRQCLISQQKSTSTNTSSSQSIIVPITPTPTTSPNSSLINTSTTSLYQTANNTFTDEIEDMDWQPTEKEDVIELSSSESSTSILSEKKIEKSTNNAIKIKSAETMGDIYDTVGENLLRLSAEKNRERDKKTKKWLQDFYYFVVDTNVLLDYLSFLEDLSLLKLCDTKGTVLYIPYGVLQELDRLKMRSGTQEGVKTLAVRAIKYLNKKFENNNLNLQAQSAIEERQHIIDVNSADDSIINCCLQAKEHVANIVLLTEDVNLRNKAICNDILVTTKSDLMCKRFDKYASGLL